MGTLNKKNLLAFSLLTISGVILASSYSDFMVQSNSFMSEVQVEDITRLDEVTERYVASETKQQLPKIVSCPTESNAFTSMRSDIEGKWTLNKYKYLANNQMDEEKIYKTVKLTMNENCEVMVNDDSEQVFNISFKSQANTMAIFKVFNEGYEVLELQKNIEVDKSVAFEASTNGPSNTEQVVEEVEKEEFFAELVLESANTPDGHLKSNLVRGTFESADGYLNIDAVVNFDTTKEKEIRISDAELNGNAFVAGDEENPIVGVITANGNKTSYTVRFSTGEYKGITLNFTTEEKLEEVEYIAEDQEELKKEINERPTNDEMVTVAQGRGFAF